MHKPSNFLDLLKLWKPVRQLARDIRCPVGRVYGWYRREYVDLDHWPGLIAAAHKRHGVVLTIEELYGMAVKAKKRR